MKAYVSYQFGEDVSSLMSLLHSKHVDIVDSRTDIVMGTSLQQAIKTSIANTDFVVLIYTQENTNLSFEAGVALGVGKPMFVVLSPEAGFHDYLYDSTCIHALPQETQKIEFGLDLFLKNLNPKKVSKHTFYGGSDQPSDYFYEKFNELQGRNEHSYETLFREIFQQYHLNPVQNNLTTESLVDFSIWSDKLSNVLSNPILVEVVKNLDRKRLNDLQILVQQTVQRMPTSSFLIFYYDLNGITKKQLPNNPKCLFIQMSDLMSDLRMVGFAEAITKLRNQIVHNPY